MRRFVCQDGGPGKFWEIEVIGPQLTVRYGRLDTRGQRKTQRLANAQDAERQAQTLIREKTQKGYVEAAAPAQATATAAPSAAARTPTATAPAAPAPSPAIKVTLRDRTGEELVLTLHGLFVISGEGSARRVQTLDSASDAKEHFERLVMLRKKKGFVLIRTEEFSADQLSAPDALELQEFDGKIELAEGRWTLTFRGDVDEKISAELASALVARMVAAAPRCVRIVCDFASPRQAWAQALAGVQLPSLESFILDTHFQSQTRQSANSIGDLAAVLRAGPNLSNLFATGALALSAGTHPSLRALHLLGDPLSRGLLQGLGGSDLPALERLVLSLCSDSGRAEQDALLDALHTLRAPQLRELHLTGLTDVVSFLDRLASRALPPALNVLSVAGAPFELDDLQRVLALRADALRTLSTLGLETKNNEDLAAARTHGPSLCDARPWRDTTLPSAYASW